MAPAAPPSNFPRSRQVHLMRSGYRCVSAGACHALRPFRTTERQALAPSSFRKFLHSLIPSCCRELAGRLRRWVGRLERTHASAKAIIPDEMRPLAGTAPCHGVKQHLPHLHLPPPLASRSTQMVVDAKASTGVSLAMQMSVLDHTAQ